jgi:hypothetical protein
VKKPETKPRRLEVFGDSMTHKLPSQSRKKRKREASKKRRAILNRDLEASE